jgi:parallel beta-helix repeat protein
VSRQNPVCFLNNGGTEEWKKNKVKIICKQKKFCGFSDLLVPNLYLSSLLAVSSLVSAAYCPTLPVFAMPQAEMAQAPRGQNPSQKNTLYVSASRGNDSGDGTQRAPLRTITRALKLAEPDTVILLAPGTYSAATGEVFPLILRSGVTVQGNPLDRGEKVILRGGGDYISPTFARQNITLLAAKGSTLSGVTVTNPNSRGYGLWVESSSPVVVKNTFTGNTHDGISVVGNSSPIVRENNFVENGANGITVYGTSQGEIRDNLFQKNGFGINVAEDAAPTVMGNRIIYNQDGILIQGKARPIVRGNYIEQNTRDGIVAIAQSFPDLGNSSEPGRNTIRNNGRYDLHNATNDGRIPAYGNIFGSDRLFGTFDLAGTAAPPRLVSPIVRENRQNSNSDRTTALTVLTPEPIAREERPLEAIVPNSNRGSSSDAIEIPVPSPENGNSQTEAENLSWEEKFRQRIWGKSDRSPSSIEIPVPESRRSRPLPWPSTPNNIPRTETNPAPMGLLPVPGPNIPLGRGGYVPPELRGVASAGGYAVALGLRYRVVVSVRGSRDTYRLRAIVPDAFEKNLNGESVMQAGAFRDRGEADQLLQLLRRNGLNARIVPF